MCARFVGYDCQGKMCALFVGYDCQGLVSSVWYLVEITALPLWGQKTKHYYNDRTELIIWEVDRTKNFSAQTCAHCAGLNIEGCVGKHFVRVTMTAFRSRCIVSRK